MSQLDRLCMSKVDINMGCQREHMGLGDCGWNKNCELPN